MLLRTKVQLKMSKRKVVKKVNPYYIIVMIDKKTEARVQKIIDETRTFIQQQAERGVDLVELAQVMLSMSRETMVDAYGEYIADTYITNQISRLQKPQNSLTLH